MLNNANRFESVRTGVSWYARLSLVSSLSARFFLIVRAFVVRYARAGRRYTRNEAYTFAPFFVLCNCVRVVYGQSFWVVSTHSPVVIIKSYRFVWLFICLLLCITRGVTWAHTWSVEVLRAVYVSTTCGVMSVWMIDSIAWSVLQMTLSTRFCLFFFHA